jgi:two-component system cell cycle sensor histidine kinase/response regulator CckA
MGASAGSKEKLAQILIVEDDRIIARDLKLMLEELGYGISGMASSGEDALALVAQKQTDLVLMDVRIKGSIDGIQTAAQIVQRFRLPVVYLTAHTDDLTLQRATETKPFGYVAKPVTLADVKVAVSVALTRFHAEQQVEERKEWLDTVLRSTSEAMVITDGNGRILFLNRMAEEITGKSNSDAAGKALDDVLQVLDEHGKPHSLHALGQLKPTGTSQSVAGALIRPDQTQRRVIVSMAQLIRQPESGAVFVLNDITDIWTQVKALEQNNEKLTFISQSLAQDLRERLFTVTLYSDLLERELKSTLSKDARENLQGISQACRQARTVMSSLLEYFSVSSLNNNEPKLLDANGPYQEALLNLRSEIKSSHAVVEASELPVVFAHPKALMLVFQNLIGNAIRYAGYDPPCVRISAQREGEFWRFTVADNGIGFDVGDGQAIFELFQGSLVHEGPGRGIGLATCQRLIQQHEGRIWAESKIGEGARFHFTIPAHERQH